MSAELGSLAAFLLGAEEAWDAKGQSLAEFRLEGPGIDDRAPGQRDGYPAPAGTDRGGRPPAEASTPARGTGGKTAGPVWAPGAATGRAPLRERPTQRLQADSEAARRAAVVASQSAVEPPTTGVPDPATAAALGSHEGRERSLVDDSYLSSGKTAMEPP